MTKRVRIIGAGLAGCEAAWQLAERGIDVDLVEMKPLRRTEAQSTDSANSFAQTHCALATHSIPSG